MPPKTKTAQAKDTAQAEAKGLKKQTGGVLAKAREAATKILKGDDWRVITDPNRLLEPLPHIPTGSVIIDYLIGGEPNAHGVSSCPGLPRGAITQLWGHESSGKSTLALTAAASVCAGGGTVLYLDWEHDVDLRYAEDLGVPVTDESRWELARPETLEEGLKLIKTFVLAGVDLVVIDSIGAAAPSAIVNRPLNETGEQARLGLNAQLWSIFLPDLKRAIRRTNTAVLGLAQMRAKIASGPASYGGPSAEPQGGHAWKYYSSARIELRRIGMEKHAEVNVLTHKMSDRVYGGVIQATMIKCKLSSSTGRKENFYIRWGEGIDDLRSVIEIAAGNGIVKKAGSWLTWHDQRAQGIEPMRVYFREHPEAFETLLAEVRPHLTTVADMSQVEDFASVDDVAFDEDAEIPKGTPSMDDVLDEVLEEN